MKRIYVGNISWSSTEEELREFFGSFGPVESVSIITDRETGRSRGFGFVEMEDEAAGKAIAEADGRELGGRTLRVNEAREREARGPRR